MTNPVSVTALTWWNMWWHPVTFWQFTDNKQSAWNNNHDKAGLASPLRPGLAAPTHSWLSNDRYSDWRIVSWEYQWSTSAVTKSLQRTFQYLISTQTFRGVFQMRANICFTFKAYTIVCETFKGRGESDSWIAQTQCGACCNENKNFSCHRCSKSHCHLRSN